MLTGPGQHPVNPAVTFVREINLAGKILMDAGIRAGPAARAEERAGDIDRGA